MTLTTRIVIATTVVLALSSVAASQVGADAEEMRDRTAPLPPSFNVSLAEKLRVLETDWEALKGQFEGFSVARENAATRILQAKEQYDELDQVDPEELPEARREATLAYEKARRLVTELSNERSEDSGQPNADDTQTNG